MKPLTQNSTSLQVVEVTDVSAPGQEGIIRTFGLPQSGTAGGDQEPNNVTVVTKLVSGLTGRSRRGRSYFAGMDEGSLAASRQEITPAFQTSLQDAFLDLMAALILEGFKLVVNSQWSGGVQRVTGVNTEVIDAITDLTLDSQRRRLPGRGS